MKPTSREPTEIRKLDRFLDEKDRNIIADQIPNAFLRVELDSKASDIPDSIGTPFASLHSRETYKDGCLTGGIRQDVGSGKLLCAFIQLERSKRTRASGMDYTFWYAFMIETLNFFPRYLVFQQMGTSLTLTSKFEPMIGIRNLGTEIGCELVAVGVDCVTGKILFFWIRPRFTRMKWYCGGHSQADDSRLGHGMSRTQSDNGS